MDPIRLLLAAVVLVLLLVSSAIGYFLWKSDSHSKQLSREVSSLSGELSSTKELLSSTQSSLASAEQRISSLEGSLANREAELENRSAEIVLLGNELKRTNQDLGLARAELNSTSRQLEQKSSELNAARDQVANVKKDLNEMSDTLESSLQWFKANSIMPVDSRSTEFISTIRSSCSDGSTLKLGCVAFMFSNSLDFNYRSDAGDRLFSLREMIDRRGGDCEDFALLFRAVLGALDPNFVLEAWKPGTSKYVIYKDSSNEYYYENAQGVGAGSITAQVYPVCYWTMVNPQGGRLGHCVDMFTSQEIRNEKDLTNLKLAGSMIIEPQSGQYLGMVGKEFLICEQGDKNCDMDTYRLNTVITKNDLFQFSQSSWKWYGKYLENLRGIEKDYGLE